MAARAAAGGSRQARVQLGTAVVVAGSERPAASVHDSAVAFEEALINLLERRPCRLHPVGNDTAVVLAVAASALWISKQLQHGARKPIDVSLPDV